MNFRDNSGYYLKNDDLAREIISFKENGVASETLGKYLLLIANNLSSKGNFNGYTWKTDMVSEAVLTCIKYLRSFNPEKANAFAYVTTICSHAFIAYIKTERKHSIIKDSCFKKYSELVIAQGENGDDTKAINYQEFGEKRKKKNTVKENQA